MINTARGSLFLALTFDALSAKGVKLHANLTDYPRIFASKFDP
jgi:hypothetical protein